jgi:hypothetical protein
MPAVPIGKGEKKMSKDCGLYRSTQPIPAGSDSIAPPRLVYYHNHSKQGSSMVLLPDVNEDNRWTFKDKGFLVADSSFIDGLEPLKPQGLYRVREHFHPDEDQIVNTNALVQLGYNGQGDPILFFPKGLSGKNAFEFPTSGMKIPPKIFELLEPIDVQGPHVPEQRHIH